MIVIRNANGRESGIIAGFFADGQIAQVNHLTTGRILTGDFGMERSDRMPDGSCLQVPPLQPFAQPRIRTRTHQMIVFQPQSTLVTIRFIEISIVISLLLFTCKMSGRCCRQRIVILDRLQPDTL
jgi:hypothetical protein